MPAKFMATDEQRRTVREMAGCGVPQKDISRAVGISEPTLRRAFRDELDRAAVEANNKVAQSLFQMATEGRNVTAAIFWLKTRAGWKEPVHHEHSGEIDVRQMSDEELERELESLQEKRARFEACDQKRWPGLNS